jgi:hypothetical protein
MPNMKTVGQRNLKLFGGQAFFVKAPVTLTFKPVSSKSIEVIYSSWLTSVPTMKTVGHRNLKLLDGQAFKVKAPTTLTFEPVTSKAIWVIFLL